MRQPAPLAAASALLSGPAPARFDATRIAAQPEPVRRYLTAAIAEGTPLWTSARLSMRGTINLGRWIPFRAQQVLAPHRGFVWAGRAAGVISGFDRYVEGAGEMRWKLLGVVPVAVGSGPDFDRSAIARPMGESMWLPSALHPDLGVRWHAEDDERIAASFSVDGVPISLRFAIDARGRVRSVEFDRWGDPDEDGAYSWHPFGGDVSDHGTFSGLTIPVAGTVGWHYGTSRWPGSAFFRYRLREVHPTGG